MAITASSFVHDPRTGQMIPDSGVPMNVKGSDTSGGLNSIPVPPAEAGMTSGAGRGRVVIKKAR